MNRGLPVSIRKINKSYGPVPVLHDVSLDVRAGEFATLLGPSGSGKTTLLMVVAGFVLPNSGEMIFGDRSVVRLPPHKRNIGMVFQSYALFPHLSVFENVAFPLRLRRLPEADIRRKVRESLALVQLADYGDRRIQQLSGGQGQRVALARAIVFEPDILLMDEPLSALDKKLREQMQIEIRRLHDELGFTTIYVTHDQREALTMSDRVAVLNGGRVEQFADPRTLYETPASAFVADFVGESTLMPVTRDGAELRLGETVLRTALPVAAGSVSLLLRPEKLRLLTNGSADPDANLFSGVVRRALFQGESVLYEVALAGGRTVSVRDLARRSNAAPEPGEAVTLALHPTDTVFVATDGDR